MPPLTEPPPKGVKKRLKEAAQNDIAELADSRKE